MSTQLIRTGNSIHMLVQGFTATKNGSTVYPRLRMSTGISIRPDDWMDKLQKPSPRYSQMDGFTLEQQLQELTAKMNVAIRKAKEEENYSVDRVKELFGNLHAPKKQAEIAHVDMLLVDLIDQVAKMKDSLLTVKAYHAFAAKVKAYQPKVKVSQLTDAWREDFFAWVKREHDLTDNSMWGTAKILNACIAHATRKKMRVSIEPLQPYTLTTPQTEVLDFQDLKRIIRYQPKDARLEEAKTFVLTMALTSIRISDLWSFYNTIAVRNGVHCAAFHTKKKCGTKHPFVMPVVMLPLAEQLAKGVPKLRSEQGIREVISDLMKACKIQKSVSPHDLRRSFLTNFIGLGVFSDILLAKVFSGHQVGGGDRSVMHGYDQGDLTGKAKTFLRILATVPVKETGGIRLI